MPTSPSYKVHFKDLGRKKLNFSVELTSLDEKSLLRVLRKQGGLESRTFEIEMITWNKGEIYVGSSRMFKVGEFTIEIDSPARHEMSFSV